MAATNVTVRATVRTDHAAWLEMWDAYCGFYAATVSPRVTDCTWQRIVASDSPVRGLVAIDTPSGIAVGFANYVVHHHTWSERPACYLEDLFVRPQRRGLGIGASLIDALLALSKGCRWSRLYWMTHEHNATARRLYDRYVARDDFVRYVIDLED